MPNRYQLTEIHHNPIGRQRVYQRRLARRLTLPQAAELHYTLTRANPRVIYTIQRSK